jgi:hypothetical protein
MADIGTLNPEQMLQQQQILRQQKMAEMLMQQGMQQPQGQMISGHYVAPSITQNLAGLANMYFGQRGIDKANQAQIDLAKQLRADEASAMADFMQQKQGKPAEMFPAQAGPMPTGGNIPLQESKAAVPPNPQAAYANLMANAKASPRLQNMAFNKLTEGPMKVGVDDVLLDQFTMKPIYQGAGKTAPDVLTAAQMLGIRGTPDTWNPQQTAAVNTQIMAMKRAGATSINMPSGEERKAGFMSSILDRNILQMQNALGVDPKAIKPNVPASIVEAITGPNLLSRGMKPEQRQIVEDSQLDVLDAALTLRTGAAYTKEQLNAMRDTYFPVLNDKPPAIAAKKQRLETLLEGAYIAAGRATPPRVSSIPTPPPPAPNNPIVPQQTNVPKPAGPRFIGFETPFTGNQ